LREYGVDESNSESCPLARFALALLKLRVLLPGSYRPIFRRSSLSGKVFLFIFKK